jgi:hypothetical protein
MQANKYRRSPARISGHRSDGLPPVFLLPLGGGTVTPCSDLPAHPGNMQVQILTPISRRICRLTALRHSPVRLLVVFALGDGLC